MQFVQQVWRSLSAGLGFPVAMNQWPGFEWFNNRPPGIGIKADEMRGAAASRVGTVLNATRRAANLSEGGPAAGFQTRTSNR